MKKKDVVAGLGEIGDPILQLISKTIPAVGYDINKKLINKKIFKKFENLSTRFLHVCIPYNKKFENNTVLLYKQFLPEGIIIHSTISPGTTKKLQNKLFTPVIYSPTRGIHKRMNQDLKRYTKFYAIESGVSRGSWAVTSYSRLMSKCGIKTKKMSSPITLELAKIIVDTSYYGWLINYAQLSKMITTDYNVNYDEMWSFSDEIHKFLGNRPKMYPGFIGGHCVIPNLELIHNQTLALIKKINNSYMKKIKNTKSIKK